MASCAQLGLNDCSDVGNDCAMDFDAWGAAADFAARSSNRVRGSGDGGHAAVDDETSWLWARDKGVAHVAALVARQWEVRRFLVSTELLPPAAAHHDSAASGHWSRAHQSTQDLH
jgi:hypothetical protein